MRSRLNRWWFRRATYPRVAFGVLLAALYVTLGIDEWLQRHDETLGWILVGGSVLAIARAAGDFSYRRRHEPPPKEQHWYDALS